MEVTSDSCWRFLQETQVGDDVFFYSPRICNHFVFYAVVFYILESLAAYLIPFSFSQQRMKYLADQAKVAYRFKDGKETKTYDALEWMAAMGCHVPERVQQSVRYYGAYANSTRGRERKRAEVFSLLSLKSIYSRAVSEQFTILRSLQFVTEYRDAICSTLQAGTNMSK